MSTTGSAYNASRKGDIIFLGVSYESIIRYYINACYDWFASVQTQPPPFPYIFVDKIAQDISNLLGGSLRLSKYSRFSRQRNEQYTTKGLGVFTYSEQNYSYYTHSYQIDTQDTGPIEFHLSGDMFNPMHPYWNKPVFEYKYTKMKTKEKHEFSFRDFGAFSDDATLQKDLSKITEDCPCNPGHYLIRFSHYSSFLCYVCPICGKQYYCDCFLPVRQLWYDSSNQIQRGFPEVDLNADYRHAICHVCRDEIPPPVFINKIYASFFMQRYAPWVYRDVFLRYNLSGYISLKSPEIREAENSLRERLGVYRIGEKWISETAMYRLIRILCGDRYEVIHHARPAFLNGMEYDVYIPDLHLAFEYDGVQHERAVDFFGGENSFKRTKERDKAKNQISETYKIKLIRIKESLSDSKLDAILKEQEAMLAK